MNDFSDHIGIIGAGISGLALGCTLAKEGHSSIIFEKNNELGSHGAGISISRNGQKGNTIVFCLVLIILNCYFI